MTSRGPRSPRLETQRPRRWCPALYAFSVTASSSCTAHTSLTSHASYARHEWNPSHEMLKSHALVTMLASCASRMNTLGAWCTLHVPHCTAQPLHTGQSVSHHAERHEPCTKRHISCLAAKAQRMHTALPRASH